MTQSHRNPVTRSGSMPRWLTVLLVVAAVVFLGPPALALLFAALGVAVGLSALLLKLGVLALGVYLVVTLLQSLFGKPVPASADQRLDDSLVRLDRDEDERRALDEELSRAVAATRK